MLSNLIYSDPKSVLTVSIYYFLTRFCGDLNSTNLLVVNIILFHFIFLLILFFSAVVFPPTFLLKLWLFFCFFKFQMEILLNGKVFSGKLLQIQSEECLHFSSNLTPNWLFNWTKNPLKILLLMDFSAWLLSARFIYTSFPGKVN